MFRENHANYADVGGWLIRLFAVPGDEEYSAQISLPRKRMVCRHNDGGGHAGLLANTTVASLHPHMLKPCIAVGTYEEKKNNGIRKSSLRTSILRYLDQFRGERAVGYISDSQPDILEGETDHLGTDFLDDDEQLEAGSQYSIGLSSIATTSHAISARSSTKMRCHLLAYLYKYARNAHQLRQVIRGLRGDGNLWVLHLCGCGVGDTYQHLRSDGCSEPSHLMVGPWGVNENHRGHHWALCNNTAFNYPQLVALIQDGIDGDGIF